MMTRKSIDTILLSVVADKCTGQVNQDTFFSAICS